MSEDAELLRRYATDRCEAAFVELVRRHLDLVYGAALRRLNGDSHLAQEIVQVVFTDVARKAGPLSRHPALAAWLHRSTRYAAAALARRETRRRRREQAACIMNADTDERDGSASPGWDTIRPWIDEALDRLDETERQAVLLRYFATRSFAEIGADLGISDEASRKRVGRALESLRHELGRRGITTTDAALAAALAAAPAVAAPVAPASAAAAAMAASAAGGSLAAGFATLMTTAKFHGVTLALGSLVGVATVGTAAFVALLAQQETERMQLSALHAQILAQRQRLPKPSAIASPRATAAAPAGSVTAPGSAPLDPQAGSRRVQEVRATHPEYAPYRAQELRLRVHRELGEFFAERGYSREKIETLTRAMALLLEGEQATRVMADGTRTRPDPKLVAEAKQILAAMEQYLGEEESRQMQRYLQVRERRGRVINFGYDAADAGLPLDQGQERALAATIADSSNPARNPDYAQLRRVHDPVANLTGLERWQLERAKACLSAEQLACFEAFLRHERERSALIADTAKSLKR